MVRSSLWIRFRDAVALIEILGAAWSTVAMTHLLLTGTGGRVIPWSFLFIAYGWLALVGFAGVMLLRRRRTGWILSVVAQALQLFQYTDSVVALRLLAGPQLTAFYLGDRLYFFAGLTTSVNLYRTDSDPAFAIGVNFAALLLLLVLVRRPEPATERHAV